MKRTIKAKNIIAFTAVLILLVSITVTPVYAGSLFPDSLSRRFGAGIAAALLGINITLESTLAPYQKLLDNLASPLNEVVEYTYPQTDWEDDILDRSVIQIWDEYTEIDGVKYTDIWLSHDAAEKFRVNAFDFQTGYSIASNTNGTYASGTGLFNDDPVYVIDGENRTQSVTYNIQDAGTFEQSGYEIHQFRDTDSGGQPRYSVDVKPPNNNYERTITRYPAGPYNTYIKVGTPSSTTTRVDYMYQRPGLTSYNMLTKYLPNAMYDDTDFDFDYTAGTIPPNQILPEDNGLMIRVPAEDMRDFIDNHIEFQNNAPVSIDFTLQPELKVDIEDLFDVLAPIIPVIDIDDVNFTVNHEAPVPVPDVPIVDATVPQVVQPIINEIQNQGDIISQSVPPIIESIPKIDEICNNIDTAPYHDLDTGLDHLPNVFLPFIVDLRSALGIWHYVTEWIGQIGTTFAFVTGCLVGTSIMTPIYAAIAGFMCIKVYRRMTG